MRGKTTLIALSLGITVGVMACARSGTAPESVGDPAEVHHAPEEGDLASVTLTAEAERRLGIETTPVVRKAVRRTRTLGAELVVPPGRSVVVTAPVAGSLAEPVEISVPDPGSLLQRNQEVLRLFPVGPQDNNLAQRRAEAEARFEAARSRATRTERLLADGAGSQRQLEEARSEFAIAKASLDAVHGLLSILGGPGEGGGDGWWSVRSPIRGTLRGLTVAAGQTVAASTPLFEVFDDRVLWVRVPVYVGDLASLDPQAPATVHGLGGDTRWPSGQARGRDASDTTAARAEPVQAPPSADPQAATVDLHFRLANPKGNYRPGQKVAVVLATSPNGTASGDLVVPFSAVLYDFHGGSWIYVNPAPRRYERRRVEVRRTVDGEAVLAHGPAPGTHVVFVGAAELFGTEFGVGH